MHTQAEKLITTHSALPTPSGPHAIASDVDGRVQGLYPTCFHRSAACRGGRPMRNERRDRSDRPPRLNKAETGEKRREERVESTQGPVGDSSSPMAKGSIALQALDRGPPYNIVCTSNGISIAAHAHHPSSPGRRADLPRTKRPLAPSVAAHAPTSLHPPPVTGGGIPPHARVRGGELRQEREVQAVRVRMPVRVR